MTTISKMTASAGALMALAFVALSAPAAQAGEYCTTNTSGMRGCGYNTMEQCQAAVAGMNGSCYRDPFLADNGNSNALVMQSKHATQRGATKQPAQH
jgi:Protein of unknown function (DUF3551)